MSPSSPERAAIAHERPLAGVVANAGALCVLTLGDAMTKTVTASLPVTQAIALRTLFFLVLLTPLFAMTARRGQPVIATARPSLHLLRSLFQLASVVTGFIALRELPLTTASAIGLVAPILVALAAIPILGERIRPHQIVAIGLGIVGCAIILRPTGEGEIVFMLASLTSAAAWSVSSVLLRRLTRTENAATIFMWSNGALALAAGAAALLDWRAIEPRLLLLLFGMAAAQVVGQWLTLTAFRVARAATVAPVLYSQILWATLVGALLFDETPRPAVWLGAGFIIAGGLWLMRGARRPGPL